MEMVEERDQGKAMDLLQESCRGLLCGRISSLCWCGHSNLCEPHCLYLTREKWLHLRPPPSLLFLCSRRNRSTKHTSNLHFHRHNSLYEGCHANPKRVKYPVRHHCLSLRWYSS